MIVLNSEILAMQLCQAARVGPSLSTTTSGPTNVHREAGDYIIQLAERIKTERQNAILNQL